MSPDDLFGSAWRLTTAPLRLAVDLGRDAIDTGERVGRALTDSRERLPTRLVDGVINALIGEQVLDRVLARIEERDVAQHVAQRVLETGMVEQVVERLLSGPEVRRMLSSAFDSGLPDDVVAQLLASEAVWVLVDEIATSPAVTEAITQQSVGFAEQVGAKARDRSREADARLQRLAGRLGRRRHTSTPGAPAGATVSGHADGEGAR
jgi:hypothetical protein